MPVFWGITDGSAGMKSQVEGVLETLGQPYTLKTCMRKRPFCWLPVAMWRGALSQLTASSDRLAPPWPAAVITSGRRSAPLGLAIKIASAGRTKAIHLTDPRACRRDFDLIVTMAHDPVEGDNVIKTRFALHRLTRSNLALASTQWQPVFAALPKPWIAVLIGGSTHRYTLNEPTMREVIASLKALLTRESGSLLITPSRRTGEANIRLLHEAFAAEKRAWIYDMQGENPYLGMLGVADYIIATNDSVNMLSEAAYTGKPVYVLPFTGHIDTKPARFADMLIQGRIARALSTARLGPMPYTIEDERVRVAHAVLAIL